MSGFETTIPVPRRKEKPIEQSQRSSESLSGPSEGRKKISYLVQKSETNPIYLRITLNNFKLR